MRSLTQQDVLQIWETGLDQHPVDRALTILAIADPQQSIADLAALSIGQRDGRLLALLEQTFGSTLAGYDCCPACREPLEFELNTADLQLAPPLPSISPPLGGIKAGLSALEPSSAPDTYAASLDGYDLQFRLPTSLDLAAASRVTDLTRARRSLAERCVIKVRQQGVDVPAQSLPEPVIAALATHLAACDPQAEIELNLACPACGHRWSTLFEAAGFLWVKISLRARRLLQEFHTLALAYGWSETQLLALSPTRRQAYLELVGNG